jgi:hypothetical protein
MDFAMAMHVLLLTTTPDFFLTKRCHIAVYFLVFTRQIITLVQTSLGLSIRRIAALIGVSRVQMWCTLHEEDLHPYHDHRLQHM